MCYLKVIVFIFQNKQRVFSIPYLVTNTSNMFFIVRNMNSRTFISSLFIRIILQYIIRDSSNYMNEF